MQGRCRPNLIVINAILGTQIQKEREKKNKPAFKHNVDDRTLSQCEIHCLVQCKDCTKFKIA